MSRADTWMPLYVADYLRDTTHLSAEEHGGYLLLLMGCWTRGGLLPAEDAKLAAIARMSPAAWKRSGRTIMEFFTREGDGWTHKRVAAELRRSQELSEKRRAAGAKGGEAKAQNAGNGLANAKQKIEQKATPARVAPPSPLPPPSEVSSVANAPELVLAGEKPEARKAPKRPIPDGWMPSEGGRRYAIERGMPPEAVEGQAERFRDFHAAKGSTFANFDAAWRTWAQNFNTFRPRVINGTDRQSPGVEKLVAVGGAMRAAFRDG